MSLTDVQIENLSQLLNQHVQYKHIALSADKLEIQAKNKSTFIDKFLDQISLGLIDRNIFTEWINFHQIDGNNYYYIYDLNEHNLSMDLLANLYRNKESLINSILDINVDNLEDTKLVGIKIIPEMNKGIFAFVSPAAILRKEKEENNDYILKTIYWGHVILDLDLNQVIIAINPSSNLIDVNNVRKNKNSFQPIADHFLISLMKITNFTVKNATWVENALCAFAEECSHHNNPQITNELNNHSSKIDTFAEKFLSQANINDLASVEHFKEEMKQVFENLLIDKYGIVSYEDKYGVFKQVGDNTDTEVSVSSKTSNLNEGNAARVAKATRNYSDVSALGVAREHNDITYRLLISRQNKGLLIRSFTSRFTEEVLIHELIRKINSYKSKVQSNG